MRRNKKLHITISVVTVCILLVTGTFAWTNFSASIVNSFFGSGNNGGNGEPGPGGTLHNDFEEGQDYRDVYVENWGTEPLIVRLMLTEYMEIGEGAGNENGAENNHATSIVDGASIDDPNTWTPFNGDMGEGIHSSNGFRYYWNWTMGGQKRYFPAPENLRGTQDENGVDFVSTTGPVGNSVDLPTVYRLTLDAEVLSMAEWINRGSPLGHYWVVDVDGYSYWAAPLEPEEATGLLLHKVELNNRPIEDFYYAINVAAHMATIDDAPDNYERLLLDASENARTLVNKVADAIREQSELPATAYVESSQVQLDSFLHRPGSIFARFLWQLRFGNQRPGVTIPPTPTPGVTMPTPTPSVTIPPTPTPGVTIPPTPRFVVESYRRTLPLPSSFTRMEPVILQSASQARNFYEYHESLFASRSVYDTTLIDSRFDDTFFSERALLFVPHRTSTMCVLLSVASVRLNNGGVLTVRIIDTNPSPWFVFMGDTHYFIINICSSLIGNDIRVEYTPRVISSSLAYR